jgi:hypothetical protein
MSQKQSITIPSELVPQFEAWGKLTAELFGRIRRQVNMSDPDDVGQEWFWSKSWQKLEQEAGDDIDNDKVQTFNDIEALISELSS